MVSNQKYDIGNRIFFYGSILYEVFLYFGFQSVFVDCRGLFRAKLNIYGKAFLRKQLTLKFIHYFRTKALSTIKVIHYFRTKAVIDLWQDP